MDGGYFEFMAHLGQAIWRTQEHRGGQGGSERTHGSAGDSPAAQQVPAARGQGPAPKPAGSVAAFLAGGLRAVGPQDGRLLLPRATDAARPKQAEASGEGREDGGACKGTTPKAAAPGPPLGRPREEAKSQPDAKGGVPVAPTAERGAEGRRGGGAQAAPSPAKDCAEGEAEPGERPQAGAGRVLLKIADAPTKEKPGAAAPNPIIGGRTKRWGMPEFGQPQLFLQQQRGLAQRDIV